MQCVILVIIFLVHCAIYGGEFAYDLNYCSAGKTFTRFTFKEGSITYNKIPCTQIDINIKPSEVDEEFCFISLYLNAALELNRKNHATAFHMPICGEFKTMVEGFEGNGNCNYKEGLVEPKIDMLCCGVQDLAVRNFSDLTISGFANPKKETIVNPKQDDNKELVNPKQENKKLVNKIISKWYIWVPGLGLGCFVAYCLFKVLRSTSTLHVSSSL